MPSASGPLPPQPLGNPGRPGLAAVDRGLRLVDVSPALAAQLGQPADLLRGLPVAEAIPGWGPALEPALRLVIATAAPALNLTLAAGGRTPVVVSLYPALSRGGAVLGVDLVVHPEAEPHPPALPVPWPEVVTALDSMPVGLALFDGRELRVRWANRAYSAFLDAPFRDGPLTGLLLHEFIPHAEASGVAATFRRVAAGGEPYTNPEYRHEGFARGPTYWRWTLVPLPRADGAFDLLLVVAEITEQVALRQEAEALAAALRQERAQLDAVLDQLPVGLYLAEAPGGRLLRHNAEARRLLGHPLLPAESQAGYAQYGALSLEGRPFAPEEHALARALRGDVVQAERQLYRRDDGALVRLEVSAAPVRDGSGAIAFAVVTFQDVGERERLLARLQQQAHLLDQAHEAMLGWEPAGPITLWNRGAEALYGFTRAETLGRLAQDILHTVHARPVAVIEAELAAHGQWQGELRHTTKDGRTIVVESRQSLVSGPDGRRVVLEANRDVTARLRAEQRLRLLQAVTASLAAAQTRAQVRRIILEDAAQGLGATRIGLRALGAQGLVLEEYLLYADADPEVLRRAALVPLGAAHPAAEAARTRAPVFLSDAGDLAARFPALAAQTGNDPLQASAHLPLSAGDELFGVLSLGFAEPRAWDEGERTFALALAGRAAVAFERARLFEAERAAREQSERLQAVTARLATALTPADVVAAVLEEGLPALGSSLGAVARLDGDELVIEGSVGFPEASSGRWRRFPLTTATPLAEAARSGEGIWLETPEAFERRYGRLPDPAALALSQASLALPLVAYGRVIGALGVSYPQARSFDPEQRRFAATLAGLCAQALERSRLYEAEREARRLVEEASRLKDEFLATVSHELRTPLTAFLGYAHLLRSRKRDEAYIARTVERMVQSAQAQAQLIEDLLDVSRIVTGRLRIEAVPTDLAGVIHAAIDTVRPAIEAKGLRLAIELDPEAGAVIGDAGRLQQVVWNLLANAAKFTPTGGTIAVRLAQGGPDAVITVSDTGQGMDPAFLPFVFDRFRQADSTTKRAHGGLGLGLAIVRHLVELHGGAVQAASPGPWQGATFTVRLPLASARAAAPPAAGPAAAEAARDCPPELRGLRVLLVDDQPAILELLEDVFALCGAQVKAFTSARDALGALRAWRPDMLVSDIAMPEEDGYWLIDRVRALAPEEGGATPAIALTAYVRIEDRLRVLAAGFQQYVPKPVEPAELRDVVARLVRSAPPARRQGPGAG